MTTRFTNEHEYITVDDKGIATIGISTYAQEQLGDVVFVDLPEVGKALAKGDEAAVVESVKAASEIYAPVSGEVTATNPVLEDTPETVNADAQGDGWLLKLRLSDTSELDDLMDETAYQDYVKGL